MNNVSKVAGIAIGDFDYNLPDSRIAKYPLVERDKCKLLVRSSEGEISTHVFSEISEILPSDSILVYNNTRVINARLRFRKGENNQGALIEIFCLEPVTPADYAQNFASTEGCSWQCFVGNSKRWKDEPLRMTIKTRTDKEVLFSAQRETKLHNSSIVRFSWNDNDVSFSEIIEAVGEIPIPPYLNRPTEASDSNDYQTVFGHINGSVAAPTAGLHFTDELLKKLDDKGVIRRELTLHVGAGTFQPVKSEVIGEHEMHSEFISVERELIHQLASTDRHVVAVGTTSVRTLESLYHIGCLIHQNRWEGRVDQWYPYSPNHPHLSRLESLNTIVSYLDEKRLKTLVGDTQIMIAPGYEYQIVDGMITNFHQPHSTLLLLVSAFVNGHWREFYEYALTNDYRFLSYGDASLLLRF